MNNTLLDQVLQQVQNREISNEKARELICVLFNESGKVSIMDRDIATIEAMHDTLLDKGYNLNDRALRESRELTQRMYDSLKINNYDK